MNPSTPLPEQGGFNKRLDNILDIFHNKMLALETITDPRDEPGDEIDYTFTEARTAIRTLILEEIIGEDWPKHCDEVGCRQCINRRQRNYQMYEQRLKLGDTHGTK